MPRSDRLISKAATREPAPMDPIDTFTFDWLGDTLFNVLLFNLVLVGPASFAMGHAMAIVWRPWHRVILYSGLLSAGLRFLDYALAGGELWSVGGFFLGWLGGAALSWEPAPRPCGGEIRETSMRRIFGTLAVAAVALAAVPAFAQIKI